MNCKTCGQPLEIFPFLSQPEEEKSILAPCGNSDCPESPVRRQPPSDVDEYGDTL